MIIDSINKNDFKKTTKYLNNLPKFSGNDTLNLIIYESLKNYNFLFENKRMPSNDSTFSNLSLISRAFQSCYLGQKQTQSYFDNLILGGHLWSATKVWDPEGLLSTIPAISSAMLGVFTGELLQTGKSKEEKTSWMFFSGTVIMFLGYVWDAWFPINKNIWTSSYVLYTGGLALLFLAFCYWLIDVQSYKKWSKPFQVYGLNAITVFFLSGIVGRLMTLIKFSTSAGDSITLKQFLYESLFLSWLEPINASLLWAVSYIFIWLGLMWILYAKKIFIKV